MAYNHPSGDPNPSPEDIALTRTLADLGRQLDVRLLDHIVVGGNRYISLCERGVIEL